MKKRILENKGLIISLFAIIIPFFAFLYDYLAFLQPLVRYSSFRVAGWIPIAVLILLAISSLVYIMKKEGVSFTGFNQNPSHHRKYFIYYFAICSPFVFALLASWWNGHSLFQTFPFWNDETNYYLQLRSMLEFGAPLGYNGYNGSHAQVSTFGFHGLGVLIPYLIFSFIFGLNFYTIALCGLFMISCSIIFYILVLRPSISQVLFLVLCSTIAVHFSRTAMMEAGFYAYMIAFATILIRISQKREPKYMVSGILFIMFISFAKPTFALLMFPLLMLILQHKKLYIQIPLAGGGV